LKTFVVARAGECKWLLFCWHGGHARIGTAGWPSTAPPGPVLVLPSNLRILMGQLKSE